MIDVLFSAFLLSVVLLGIHSYYGLHIIERGIIFTDLGIGQMAAFGAAIAILAFDGKYMYPVSLVFSLLGALLIAVSTKRTRHHEAFIGLLYAFGMSAAVIALSRAPRGAEQMEHLIRSLNVGHLGILAQFGNMPHDRVLTNLHRIGPRRACSSLTHFPESELLRSSMFATLGGIPYFARIV